MAYKDKDKQKQANRERQKRYRAWKASGGVTAEGVTPTVIPEQASHLTLPEGVTFEEHTGVRARPDMQATEVDYLMRQASKPRASDVGMTKGRRGTDLSFIPGVSSMVANMMAEPVDRIRPPEPRAKDPEMNRDSLISRPPTPGNGLGEKE